MEGVNHRLMQQQQFACANCQTVLQVFAGTAQTQCPNCGAVAALPLVHAQTKKNICGPFALSFSAVGCAAICAAVLYTFYQMIGHLHPAVGR